MARTLMTALFLGITSSLALCHTGVAQAERLAKGTSLVLAGIGGHSGKYSYPGFSSTRFENGEVGVEVAYYRFVSDAWSLGIAGGFHAGGLKSEENSPPGTLFATTKVNSRSIRVRIGGDRYAFIDDRVALYAGPGLYVARGRANSELRVEPPAVGGGSSQSPLATEFGLSGRIGMHASLGERLALFGHVGQNLSRTSAKDARGGIAWWTSTHDGAIGLALHF